MGEVHHRLKHLIKEKMIEKNKAIRLAAAKKTIVSLSDEKLGSDKGGKSVFTEYHYIW